MGIAGDIALILVAALLGGVLARWLGLPSILGYIAAGVLVGPNTFGPSVGDVHEIELLAEIGVALLLFTIGLHFTLGELAPVRRIALLVPRSRWRSPSPSATESAACFGSGMGRVGVAGALFSLSSTAVVLKTLGEQGFSALSARVMIGMLIVQDLAIVVLLTVLVLENVREGLPELSLAVLKAAFIAAMLLLGSRILPMLLARLAAWGSRELFLVSVVAIGVGVGYATYLVGLSFAFGAFVAGWSSIGLQPSGPGRGRALARRVCHDLLRLRGTPDRPLLSVGELGTIVLVVVLILLVKGLIFGGLWGLRLRQYSTVRGGIGALSGRGVLVLARQGGGQYGRHFPGDLLARLATAAVTMALTPLAARLAPVLYGRYRRGFPESPCRPSTCQQEASGPPSSPGTVGLDPSSPGY